MSLKKLRMSRNMTQEELATKFNITRSTVAMWENGCSFPRVEMLIQLATFFGCTVDDLLK